MLAFAFRNAPSIGLRPLWQNNWTSLNEYSWSRTYVNADNRPRSHCSETALPLFQIKIAASQTSQTCCNLFLLCRCKAEHKHFRFIKKSPQHLTHEKQEKVTRVIWFENPFEHAKRRNSKHERSCASDFSASLFCLSKLWPVAQSCLRSYYPCARGAVLLEQGRIGKSRKE